MGGHKREDKGRNQKNMGYEKPRDGKGPHLRATAHQALDALTNPGDFADGVCSNRSGKISSLIPREQVTSEGHGQHQPKERASRQPKKLAPSFIGSVDVRL